MTDQFVCILKLALSLLLFQSFVAQPAKFQAKKRSFLRRLRIYVSAIANACKPCAFRRTRTRSVAIKSCCTQRRKKNPIDVKVRINRH